jgi:hypothetical protein
MKICKRVYSEVNVLTLVLRCFLATACVLLLVVSPPAAYADDTEASGADVVGTAADGATGTTADEAANADDTEAESEAGGEAVVGSEGQAEESNPDATDTEPPATEPPNTEPTDTEPGAASKGYIKNIQRTVSIADINRLDQIIPQTIDVNDVGYKGKASLDPDNPYTIEGIYEPREAQIDKLLVLEGLPDNDAVRLEQNKSFTVRSKEAPDATIEKELELADAGFEISKISSLGLPVEYTANLTYRGTEDYLLLTAYKVTAHYLGTEVPAAQQEIVIPKIEVPLIGTFAAAETPLFLAAAAAGVVIILAGLLFWLLVLRKNLRFMRGAGAGSELLFRRQVKIINGIGSVEIPANINIADGAQYQFVLKPSLAKQEGYLVVSWCNRVISQELLAEQISVDFRQIIAKDTVVALEDELTAMAFGA